MKDYFAQTKNFPLLKNGVYHQRDFLRIFHQQLSVSTPYVAKQVEGKNIVVIGNQHGAFISIEPFVGVLPDLHQKPIPRTARSVTVLGLPARNKHEFLEYVRPGGAEVDASKASLFQERYTRYGLADAIGNFVRTIPDRATKVDWNLANPADKPIVTYRNAEGLVQRIQADIVIVSTGYDSRMQMEKLFGNPPQGLFYPIDLGGEIQMQPITVQTGETNFVYGQGTVERYTEVAYKVRTRQPDNVDRIFVYGAGAGLRPTLQELNASITGSPDSINILAPKTEYVADFLLPH